jgi:LysR family pca operon transcriptional activator
MNQRIKLRHLRVFVEVARRGSVIGAARGLHVSQPAVTKTIRDLEETLGVRLFRRDGRRIRITAQGEVFLHHAGTALSAVRQGVDALSRGSEGGPRIRVGALPTVSARIMPGAMQRFLRDDTGSRVRIETGETAVMLEQLRLGELDIVLGRLAEPERMVGFFFEHLYSERVVFVVRPGHPLLASRDGPFPAVGGYPMLVPPAGSIIRPFVDRFFITRGLARSGVEIETVSDSFGRAFVRGSDAVWAISEGVVAGDVSEGTLATLPLDTADTTGPVGLTMRTDSYTDPALALLLHAIRAAARTATASSA